MENGFMDELRQNAQNGIKCVSLIQLKVPMSIGACYLASNKAHININKTYDENTNIFFKADLWWINILTVKEIFLKIIPIIPKATPRQNLYSKKRL